MSSSWWNSNSRVRRRRRRRSRCRAAGTGVRRAMSCGHGLLGVRALSAEPRLRSLPSPPRERRVAYRVRPDRPRRRRRRRAVRAVRGAAAGRGRPRGARSSSASDLPGGRAGRLELGGYSFDTGPTVLTMPDLIAETLGRRRREELDDWLDADPARPGLPRLLPGRLDASTSGPTPTTMADEIAQGLRAGRGGRLPAVRRVRHRAVRARDAALHRPQPRLAARPRPAVARPAGRARRVPPAGTQGRRATSRTSGPADCCRSRRCTPDSPRTTRSRSTRSSPTWTPSPASTPPSAACTRCPGHWPAPPRSTASPSATGRR